MDPVALSYAGADAEIREDLPAAHAQMLEHFRRPGSWFTGVQRNAIAAESRRATDCALCRARKTALSPEHVHGQHAESATLSAALVELIHRVRTDSGRLSQRFFALTLDAGVSEGQYVEAVGIVAMTAGLDLLCRALGIEVFALREPVAGKPSGHVPDGLSRGIAWVPLLLPENARGPDADIYGGASFVPNIVRALSLVPDHVRALRAWSDVHYLSVSDLSARRALDRPQIELVAARVSALNQCFY